MGYRVLALISGGKDSCFAMMSCVTAGHEIVALANLRPKDQTGYYRYFLKLSVCLFVMLCNCNPIFNVLFLPLASELDSYMFQTVGHEAIELYAEAMRLPLFRGDIKRSKMHSKVLE